MLIPDNPLDPVVELEPIPAKERIRSTLRNARTINIEAGELVADLDRLLPVYAMAFPELFPYGTGDRCDDHPVPLSVSDWVQHLLLLNPTTDPSDRRFACNTRFHGLAVRLLLKGKANTMVWLAERSGSEATDSSLLSEANLTNLRTDLQAHMTESSTLFQYVHFTLLLFRDVCNDCPVLLGVSILIFGQACFSCIDSLYHGMDAVVCNGNVG